jgi:hypothetical protein
MHEITDLGYNPFTDITADVGLPLAWATDKPKLQQYFINYFQSRDEDGAKDKSCQAL